MVALLLSCKDKSNIPQGFQIESGFQLELVAHEPIIADPVDLEFTETGDALVLEMPGYPFEDQQSRIVLLKDSNRDGVYDERLLFAENLQLASSIMPYKNGVLVAAPPYLLHVKDIDRNNMADAVDTLMGGFSTGNLQHNYNGLTYGLDNWIYAVNGGNSGQPYWWGDTTTVMDLRGEDFRFNLEKKVMERIGESSGGFGLGMDEWGHLYETHNLTHISHLVFPERYRDGMHLIMDHTLHNISDHEENGLARIYPIGEQESRVNHPEQSGYFSGSCGITYYGGGAFGPAYDQTVWVADVVLNLIHVDKVNASGSSMSASRMLDKKDFLASSDRSFRPVNMTVGPDGSLYIVDMYRQVIEHPEWIPDEIEKDLDLEAGKDKGRIYKISRAETNSVPFDFEKFRSVEGMISALRNSNQWVRKTAHRLLVDHIFNEDQLELLKGQLKSDSEFARLHALWILETTGKLDANQLSIALHDVASGIRENALIISEKYINTNQAILRECLALSQDTHQRVRMQAALTLSTINKRTVEENKQEILKALQGSASITNDEWNTAALTLASKHVTTELFIALASSPDRKKNDELLGALALNAGHDLSTIQLILKALHQSNISQSLQATSINKLTAGIQSVGSANLLIQFIQPLEKTGDLAVITSLATLRKKLNLSPSPEFLKFSSTALKDVVDKSLPDSIRIQQLSLLELVPYNNKSAVLFQCIQNTQPLKLQEGALRQLSTYPEPEIGKQLIKQWNELGPQARKWASDLLLYIEIHHDALLTGLEDGTINIGEMNFDLERRRTLLWWTDNENTKRRAEALFSDAGVLNRKEAIDKMKPALTLTGSVTKGATVFETICSQCHVYGTKGQDVGPVLTEISRKSKESLLHDILDPNAAADTKYINHRVETLAGIVHMGIVDSETDQSMVIKKMGGEKITINKTEIKKFNSLGSSLMMEGLENSMTPQDLADLLAFLQNGN
ncbi:MAG: c-type cytochrome [Cyclobacteriaceae bacterium]|nr:c-type cytochrome [Cyclobacteriaceae bacterium]